MASKIIFSIKKSKKSQMEMFGIAIVVILLSLGMLFGVRFVLLKPQSDLKQSFSQKEIAQTFVSALMITTVLECHNQDFTKLLEDCATYQNIRCGQMSSCEFLRYKIPDILEKTLGVWQRPYKLTVTKDARVMANLVFNSTRACIESRPGWAYIPLYPGLIEVRLDVC